MPSHKRNDSARCCQWTHVGSDKTISRSDGCPVSLALQQRTWYGNEDGVAMKMVSQ
jgi:hypothetical protein